MTVFANSEELVRVMNALWGRIKADPEMSARLVESKLCVQFRYRNPEGVFTIDCTDGKQMLIYDTANGFKPTIEMSMKADVAHEFWMGRISVPVALLTGKIVSRGPTAQALKLLPAIKPAFALYPEVLKEAGKETLLSK